ncbi:cytochrome-c peroxidase [Flammeovirga kamogawensis]|uniref:Cytochrome-c peroxidase n=1 Tax=Flammeovirga kamogawensis TaxID=373891 RepID=A0ABX8GY55_9BACT|nr:cytochrome-c peroxidase [Flammeovirga kamogawensis]MBB6458929.1 cytochrome c peroxidase [Flammeovirga kamogawensis]QWG08505.1 cytochrome-c peroxidase [Flammeovirga kamogawensis]TRX66798.1 cytochrome-c peroxidase [Flammeovirga kamogawensis]
MERHYWSVITLLICSIYLEACDSSFKEETQASVISYQNIPAPERNKMNAEKVALGKMLFNETILSKDSSIACVHCHEPQYANGENVALSTKGVSHKKLQRNSPALINVAWAKGWFWDGGAKNIESLIFGPLTHEDEMNADLKEILVRLNQTPIYKAAFRKTFDIEEIKSAHLARALAQYVRSLLSNQTKYDAHLKGNYQFTKNEQSGLEIFKRHCQQCHTPPFFTDFDYHNNGLDKDDFFTDLNEGMSKGRGRISRNKKDNGKYKTPTLRYLNTSSPYMHDGRFATLDEVFDHYTTTILKSETLDSLLYQRITLTKEDRLMLKAFLHTLDQPNSEI